MVANVDAVFVDRITRVIVVEDAAHNESVDNAKSTIEPVKDAAFTHALLTNTNKDVVFVDESYTATAIVAPSDATCCTIPAGNAGPNAVGPGAILTSPHVEARIVPNDPALTAELIVPNWPDANAQAPAALNCKVDTVPADSCRTADGCTIKVFVPSDDRSTAPTTVADANTPSTLDPPATALSVPTAPGVNSVGAAAGSAAGVAVGTPAAADRSKGAAEAVPGTSAS